MSSHYRDLAELFQSKTPCVSVVIVDATGSTPQDVGAKMIVTAAGLHSGTVGGGKIEARAIEEAKALLADRSRRTHFVNWSLSKDIGMTCGGQVKLYFEKHIADQWRIVIFGAGHIANALISIINKLECQITCIDPRPEWLDKLPKTDNLSCIQTSDMPAEVDKLDESNFVLLMTMGHSTDSPILLRILGSKRFSYLGVIGSRAKAARLKNDVRDVGLPAHLENAFLCPVGLDLGSNHPQEIAISIAAQLIEQRDAIHKESLRPDIKNEI